MFSRQTTEAAVDRVMLLRVGIDGLIWREVLCARITSIYLFAF